MSSVKHLLSTLLVFVCVTGQAAIPNDYQPVVVEAPFSLRERLFDLTPALEASRKTGKPLFIYLGAADCPPCLDYKKFLGNHRTELKEAFSQVVVVDIRTWLRGPAMVLKVDEKRLNFKQFKALVGDNSKDLVFPSFWLLSPDLKALKQLPSGTQGYLNVGQHLDLLKLPNQSAHQPIKPNPSDGS